MLMLLPLVASRDMQRRREGQDLDQYEETVRALMIQIACFIDIGLFKSPTNASSL